MPQKRQIVFIVNPISGTKDKKSIVTEIDSLLDKQQFDYKVEITQYAGHAREISQKAKQQGVDIVVAVGGDGTVNEVACELIGSPTALGIIPCGSGDGLARHLKIPLNLKGAVKILNTCCVQPLDYATVNGTPFFVTCGMGFDAYVSYKFAEAKTRGVLTYLEQALTEWLRYKPETYIVENGSGTETYKAFLITCANTSEYGNNAYIAPNASMNDGMLDVTIVEPFNAIEAPQLALQLFAKTLRPGSRVRMLRTSQLTVKREHDGVIHCDGDPVKAGKELHFEVVHNGINIVTNPEAENEKVNIFQNIANLADELQRRSKLFAERNNPISVINKLRGK
jgi:diacylglycerol kinase (ATP)